MPSLFAMSPPLPISDAGRACLRLHLSEGVGPVRFRRLVERFGSPGDVLEAGRTALQGVEGVGRKTADALLAAKNQDIEPEIAAAAAAGVRIIGYGEAEYPALLREIPDPPICLYVRGSLTDADARAVAVVGARRCTHYGAEQARHFGGSLARAGLTVVSGLARGIDSQAHHGALEAGGRTLAVLGGGLGEIYPPEHGELAERVVRQGALLSEMPMTTPPDEARFPQRNRIIAGLSCGVLVVEGTRRSGSLITARVAVDYNREVFAIPGRVDNETASGPNQLIRDQHAKLVMRLEDIVEELGIVGFDVADKADAGLLPGLATPASAVQLTEVERAVLEAMRGEACSVDRLLERVSLGPAQVTSTLTMLQLKACVKLQPGNVYVPTGRAVRK